tara:strand:- start:828 stop:1511 length:684 start_codon:yes stop_codon:yes gene_type:complete
MRMSSLPTRRFGRTEIPMPVLSLGGMRFQQSWSDLEVEAITAQSQRLLQSTLERAVHNGFHHVETARHYGSSERQLGWALPDCPDPDRILQTKVPPQSDPTLFEAELELSFARLNVDRVDLLSIHGINLHSHLDQTIRPGGCLDVVRRWQAEGRVGHVGFSTHGDTAVIVDAIETGAFDYVNLHWYFIRQDNEPAIAPPAFRTWACSSSAPLTKGDTCTPRVHACWS